mmetsp:Transcript_97237/g.225416  ORF Transcript_97237/g.225416 Transcript_97237/m.225416 type:complete len:278 (-) Transcript_97237:268-1101(-)
MKGFLYVGIPSPSTAFINRRLLLASWSTARYMVDPFRLFFAARMSSRDPCLKYARPPATTKAPTSIPFRLSCVSQAFFSASTSSTSAWATLSMPGQSASSITSHSCLPSWSPRGSNPCCIGLMISPGKVFTSSWRPSRCSTLIWKPHRASTREIVRSMKRSAPFRLKSLCSCCLTAKTTSPVSASGCSSAISRKTILCPSGKPFWTCTSNTSLSCLVWKDLPLPPHALQDDCICWIIGPIRMTSTFTPLPPHSEQVTIPFCLSMTCRVMAIFFTCPV